MTVKEIAALANVSPATVSLVINNKEGVGDDTRKKVLDIIDKNGYIPKSKVQKNRGNIRFIKYKEKGLLVERNGDFISRVIDGIEDKARSEGINLKITNVTSENFESMIEDINFENDDGIVFLGTEFNDKDSNLLKKFYAPVVVVDNEMKNINIDSVVMNNCETAFMAIKYLNDLGHKRIGHIASACVISNFKSRNQGYYEAMEGLGLDINENDIYSISPDINTSYSMLLEQWKGKTDFPTAFFADNDILAIGAIRALKSLGKNVPEDISIIGVDDLMMSSISDPGLTTLKIHKKKMGELAVCRLVKIMKEGKNEVVKSFLGSEITIRGSASTVKQW